MSKFAPCKECTNRYCGCHDKCEDYKIYKQINEVRKQTIRENRARQTEIFKYKAQRIAQAEKHKKGKR